MKDGETFIGKSHRSTYPERDPKEELIAQQRRTIGILQDLVEDNLSEMRAEVGRLRERVADLEHGRAA